MNVTMQLIGRGIVKRYFSAHSRSLTPALDVSGNTCEHITYDEAGLPHRCGAFVAFDKPNGFLCDEHQTMLDHPYSKAPMFASGDNIAEEDARWIKEHGKDANVLWLSNIPACRSKWKISKN